MVVHEWQRKLLDDLGGIKKGDMHIIMSGRRIGKSAVAQMWNMVESKPAHTVIADAIVDGEKWYTIGCNSKVAAWVREQPGEGTQWDRLIDARWYIYNSSFDVHEEFYMMLKLRWGA